MNTKELKVALEGLLVTDVGLLSFLQLWRPHSSIDA